MSLDVSIGASLFFRRWLLVLALAILCRYSPVYVQSCVDFTFAFVVLSCGLALCVTSDSLCLCLTGLSLRPVECHIIMSSRLLG